MFARMDVSGEQSALVVRADNELLTKFSSLMTTETAGAIEGVQVLNRQGEVVRAITVRGIHVRGHGHRLLAYQPYPTLVAAFRGPTG